MDDMVILKNQKGENVPLLSYEEGNDRILRRKRKLPLQGNEDRVVIRSVSHQKAKRLQEIQVLETDNEILRFRLKILNILKEMKESFILTDE